jgi:hypothetical protein
MIDKLLGFFFRLLSGLVPPLDATPERLHNHRVSVAILIVFAYLVVGVHISWICGFVPHVPGAAWASDLDTARAAWASDLEKARSQLAQRQDILAEQGNFTQLMLVKGAIKQTLKDACTALDKGNQPALDLANNEMETLAEQYRTLTHETYMRPNCSVILIKSSP